ncbi:hypothetical protein [Metallibacterium sp.]
MSAGASTGVPPPLAAVAGALAVVVALAGAEAVLVAAAGAALDAAAGVLLAGAALAPAAAVVGAEASGLAGGCDDEQPASSRTSTTAGIKDFNIGQSS